MYLFEITKYLSICFIQRNILNNADYAHLQTNKKTKSMQTIPLD